LEIAVLHKKQYDLGLPNYKENGS